MFVPRIKLDLSLGEVNTILAALRMWQAQPNEREPFRTIAEWTGHTLTDEETDALIDSLPPF